MSKGCLLIWILLHLKHAICQKYWIEAALQSNWILSSTYFNTKEGASIVGYDSDHERVIIFGGTRFDYQRQSEPFTLGTRQDWNQLYIYDILHDKLSQMDIKSWQQIGLNPILLIL